MKAQMNMPYNICKVMVIITILVMAVFCFLGCPATKRESVKTQLSAVLQLAYENGGKAAVSNRIEELVVEGKLSQERVSQLQALAEIACEKFIIDFAREGAVEDTKPTGERRLFGWIYNLAALRCQRRWRQWCNAGKRRCGFFLSGLESPRRWG